MRKGDLKRATGHGKAISDESTALPQPGDWVRRQDGAELVICELYFARATDGRVLASCAFGPNTWIDLNEQPTRERNSHEQQARMVWKQWTKGEKR